MYDLGYTFFKIKCYSKLLRWPEQDSTSLPITNLKKCSQKVLSKIMHAVESGIINAKKSSQINGLENVKHNNC